MEIFHYAVADPCRGCLGDSTPLGDFFFACQFESTVLIQGPRIANEYKALFETHSSIGTFKKILKEVLFSTMV